MSDIDAAITEYKQKATASLDIYAGIARRAAERLTTPAPGASAAQPPPPPPPTWMEDIVTFWSTAGQDALNLLTLQQKLAAQATKK